MPLSLLGNRLRLWCVTKGSVVYLKLVKDRRPKFPLNFGLTAKPGLVPPPLEPWACR